MHVKGLSIETFSCHDRTYATSHQDSVIPRTQFFKYPPDVRAMLDRQCEGVASSGMRINAEYRRLVARYQLRG